jgi:hypothetical protein
MIWEADDKQERRSSAPSNIAALEFGVFPTEVIYR